MHTSKAQTLLKEAFVLKHKLLCRVVLSLTTKQAKKTRNGKLLLELARTELKYSCRTADCDIFCSLFKSYNKLCSNQLK